MEISYPIRNKRLFRKFSVSSLRHKNSSMVEDDLSFSAVLIGLLVIFLAFITSYLGDNIIVVRQNRSFMEIL